MNTEPAKDDTNARVLVVDDEAVIRSALRRILKDAGFNVTAVAGAQAALDAIATLQFDAIVTDIMMPGMDGIELLSQIRQRDRELPVIILTGYPTLDSAIVAAREGGFRYLKKPCPPEELCGTVREATAIYRLTLLKRLALATFESGSRSQSEPVRRAEQFDEAIGGLWMAYQPIVHWPDKKVFGYEALVRTGSSGLSNPGLLFDAAERLDRVHELGRQIRRLVADTIRQAPPDATLFVNLHSADLNDEELYSVGSPLSEHTNRVVLEVTERASLKRVKDIQGGMTKLRKLGYRIACKESLKNERVRRIKRNGRIAAVRQILPSLKGTKIPSGRILTPAVGAMTMPACSADRQRISPLETRPARRATHPSPFGQGCFQMSTIRERQLQEDRADHRRARPRPSIYRIGPGLLARGNRRLLSVSPIRQDPGDREVVGLRQIGESSI